MQLKSPHNTGTQDTTQKLRNQNNSVVFRLPFLIKKSRNLKKILVFGYLTLLEAKKYPISKLKGKNLRLCLTKNNQVFSMCLRE